MNTHDTPDFTFDVIFHPVSSILELTNPEKVTQLQIINAAGQVIFSKNNVRSTIDVDFLLTGINFVTIVSDIYVLTKKNVKL